MHSDEGQDPAVETPAVEAFDAGTVAVEAVADEPIEPIEPIEPDPVLLAAGDQARAALAEITDAANIGEPAGHEVNGAHVLTLFFENAMPGYPGWRWAAAVARVDEESAVNVLEVELLPGPGSLTAPAWLPWSERLAQYRETQAQLAADGSGDATAVLADGEDLGGDDLDDDILVNDFSDFDDEIDGVDVDGDDVDDDIDDEGEDAGELDDDDEDDDDDDFALDEDDEEE